MKKFIRNMLLCMMAFLLSFQNLPMGVAVAADNMVEINENRPTGLIYALGIAPEGGELSGVVTRGEFAGLLANFIKLDTSQNSNEKIFEDVTKSTANAGAIDMLYQAGYMSGDGNGNFRPNDAITYNEVLAAVVNVLDYGVAKYSKIEYPGYHLKKANDWDITIKITGQSLTRGDVYLILERALEAPYRVVDGISGGDYILSSANTSVLTEIHDVYWEKGVVTQNFRTSLYSADALDDKNRIGIENTTYFTTDNSISERLGEKVKFYYRDDNGNKTVIFYTDTNGYETISVKNEHLEGYSSGTLKYTLENEHKVRNLKISERANVIYNGVYYKKGYDLKNDDFDINEGSVTLISYNNSTYDTVIINSYTFGIFGRMSSDGEKIFMDVDNTVYLLENYESVTFIKDGAEIEPSQISGGDVFNILEDKNNKYMTVYVSNNIVDGTLEQRIQSDEETTYIIDGKEYNLNYMFDVLNTKEAKIGRSDIFVLDMFENIVALQVDSVDVGKYGVLLEIGKGEKHNIVGQVKFLNSKNRIKIFDITKKTSVNGVKYKSYSEFKWFIDNEESLRGKLVTFETNSKGELTKLCIESVDGYEEEFTKMIDNKRLRYKSGSQLFGDAQVGVRDNTAIFIISDTINEDDDCECITRSLLDGDAFYYISAYNYNEYNVADVIVVHQDAGSYEPDSESAVFVLEKVIGAIDKDDNDVYKLIGMTDGKESNKHYWFEQDNESINLAELKPGNVLLLRSNSRGEVLAVTNLFNYDPTNLDFYYESSSVLLGKIFGQVERISGDMCLVNVTEDGEDMRILKPAGTIYVYDREEKEVRLGSTADIFPGSYIFVRERYQTIKEIIIYEE